MEATPQKPRNPTSRKVMIINKHKCHRISILFTGTPGEEISDDDDYQKHEQGQSIK